MKRLLGSGAVLGAVLVAYGYLYERYHGGPQNGSQGEQEEVALAA